MLMNTVLSTKVNVCLPSATGSGSELKTMDELFVDTDCFVGVELGDFLASAGRSTFGLALVRSKVEADLAEVSVGD